MKGFIDGINFELLENQKYYSFPATYSPEKRKTETFKRIYSNEWIGSWKHDGAFYKFIKDEEGNMMLLGRSKGVNGNYINRFNWVPQLHPFFQALPNGTCLLGECYFPNNEGSHNVTTIMGCIKERAISRQIDNPLHYYIFDCLAWNGSSLLNSPACDRFDTIDGISPIFMKSDFVHKATHITGAAIWDKLQELLNDGYEGMVLIKADSVYEPGKRPSKTTLKVKKELRDTIDCYFTGRYSLPTQVYSGKEIETWQYWENTITGEKIRGSHYQEYVDGEPIQPVTKPWFNGWAGSLEIAVKKDGEDFSIGTLSGLTDEVKSDPKKYAGRCIEVTAMQFTDDHKLRHGKMVDWRDDLTPNECTYEKFMK